MFNYLDQLYFRNGAILPTEMYHRISKLKPRLPDGDTSTKKTEDYTEQLTIERESESVEHIKRVDSECVVSHKYQIKRGVPDFLDSFDADFLFKYIEGNPADATEDPNESREYTITVDFRKKPQRIIRESYDKNGLHED